MIEQKLHSIRLLTKTNKLPKWGERFINSNVVKIVEESILDPSKQTFVTYTRNVGFTSVMVCIYLICGRYLFYIISKGINLERDQIKAIPTSKRNNNKYDYFITYLFIIWHLFLDLSTTYLLFIIKLIIMLSYIILDYIFK